MCYLMSYKLYSCLPSFQIPLAGIYVVRIDYSDQTNQHFWIGQAVAITRIMFSRFHSLPEGL